MKDMSKTATVTNTCNHSFSASINISRQNEYKEAVKYYQMKVVEF